MIPTKAEVIAAIQALCVSTYGGDYQAFFNNYAVVTVGGTSEILMDGLESLLTDANVGNWMDRSTIAAEIMSQLDTDKDGGISYAEALAAVAAP